MPVEAVEHESVGHESVEHEFIEDESIELESVEHESIEHETIEHESIEPESVEHESIEYESVEHESIEHESIEHESVEHESIEPVKPIEPLGGQNEPIDPYVINEIVTTLECENCDFSTSQQAAFNKHKNSLVNCKHCPKMFCGRRAKANRESHEKKDHDFKPKTPYFCQVCE